jgi:hypothetical protein
MTVLGAATRLAGAAGPVCRVRPAMFRMLTTRRGCRPAFSATKAWMTNECAPDPNARRQADDQAALEPEIDQFVMAITSAEAIVWHTTPAHG